MVQSPGFTRPMHPGEDDAADRLLRLAHDGGAKAGLVKALRKSGAMAGEMVLPCEDRIIGYYALSTMNQPKGWLCLAAVAIHPDWQGLRHGKRMIGQLAEWARLSGVYVVAAHTPGFFIRAGFSLPRAAGLTSRLAPADLTLAGPGDDVPQQVLSFPKPFGVS